MKCTMSQHVAAAALWQEVCAGSTPRWLGHLHYLWNKPMSNWMTAFALFLAVIIVAALAVVALQPCESGKVKVRGVIGYECVSR